MENKKIEKLNDQELEQINGGTERSTPRVPDVCPLCGTGDYLQPPSWTAVPGKYVRLCNCCYIAIYYNEDGTVGHEEFYG